MGRLQDRVAIVTGGGGGIGAATARRLVRDGARVVLADVDEARAAEAAAAIGEGASAIRLDQGEECSVQDMVGEVVRRHGRIDILHNNAALTAPDFIAADLDVAATDISVWDQAYRVNLRGYVLCAKYVLPHMVSVGGGVVVNMSSFGGLSGDVARTAYGCMKAAVVLLTQSIATSHGARGVRCVAVAPGTVLSENMRQHVSDGMMDIILRHHLTRDLGVPEDVANLVAFLASDEARYITGVTIPIDGGLSSHSPMVADFVSAGG